MRDDKLPRESIIPAAERTLRVIELMLSRPEGWTPQELLVELDLSRSSMFVLLRSLKTLGYVEQAGKRGRYIPGPRLQVWRAPQSPSAQDMLTAFYQETELALQQRTERSAGDLPETFALAVPASSQPPGRAAGSTGYFIVAQVESSQQVRSAFSIGQLYPDLPAARDVLNPTPPTRLVTNGYSLVAGQAVLDLALPVCRDGFTPEAALLLSAPAYRWTPDRLLAAYLDELRDMAAHLSYRLGSPFYAPYRSEQRQGLSATTALQAEEIAAFLHGPWAASLACVRPDGKPHVIPVWQEWDGKAFTVIAWQGSQWADYVRQNPHVSLTIDEPWAPLRRVVVQGRACPLESSPAGLDRLLQRMTRRYLGQPAALGVAQQVQGAFSIQPSTLRGWRGLPVRGSRSETTNQ